MFKAPWRLCRNSMLSNCIYESRYKGQLQTCKMLSCRAHSGHSGLIAYLEGETRLTRPIPIPAFLNRRRLTILIKTTIKQLRNSSFPWGQNFGCLNARPGEQGQEAEAQTLLHSGSTCDWLNRRRNPTRSWRSHEDNISMAIEMLAAGFFPIYALDARAG